MATYAENIRTARDNVAANLAAITATPKPNYSIDGVSYSWQSLFDAYTSQLERLNQALQVAEGGFEIRAEGVT